MQAPSLFLLDQVVVDIVKSIPDFAGFKALDLGCGDGRLLEYFSSVGMDVTGTVLLSDEDYIRTRRLPHGLKIRSGVDLNRVLPFADASFDLVYSTEVIEHLESHSVFISESARVLKKGGYLILTTPNTHRLVSRLNFAFSGMLGIQRQLIPWDECFEKLYAYHNRCIDFSVFHWLLWKQNIRIQQVKMSWSEWPSRLLFVFAPLFRYCSRRYAQQRHWKNPGDPPPSSLDFEGRFDMLKWLNSSVGMKSAHWCVLARKF